MADSTSTADTLAVQFRDLNEQAESKLSSNPRECIALAQRALELARRSDVHETQPQSLFIQAMASLVLAETDVGETLFAEAARHAEELGQTDLQIRATNGLGTVAHQRGDYGKAFTHYHRCLSHARAVADPTAEARALGNIGLLYFEMGEFVRSVEIGEQVLAMSQSLKHTHFCVNCAANLAEARVALGDYEKTIEYVARWLPVAAGEGFEMQASVLLGHQGAAKLGLGRVTEALADLEEAVRQGRLLGDFLELSATILTLGEAHLALGQTEAARASFAEVFERCGKADWIALQLRAARLLMALYESEGRCVEALSYARTVLRLQEHIYNERLSRRTAVLAVEFEIDQFRNQAEIERQKLEVLQESNQLLHRLQENLQHEATHDPLTGVFNRRHFLTLLSEAIDKSRHSGERFGIAYLDLDDFKDVNDSFGHTAGDVLLVEVAHRLSRATRAEDAVARLGGDEFAVILKNLQEPKDAEERAQRLTRSLGEPVRTGDLELRCGVSVGVATYPEHGPGATELLHAADSAMYLRKRARKSRR